jgi:hypothetical protein
VQKQVTDTFTSSTWTPRPNCDQVNAYGVVILWQSTDHYGIVPPPTTSGQAAARTTSACPTPKNNNGNDSGERLSTSDRVSIGVGLGVGVPSLLLTIWFGWYTRKSYHIKKRKENEAANGIAARSAEWEGLTSKTADIAAVADSPLVEGPPAHSSSVRALPGVDIATLHE